ncbi:MAG: glycosyltransferase [Bacteroidota bacterium]
MKILLVSWSVLPSPGGSSVIVENLAKNFSSDELIVLGSRTMFQQNNIDRGAASPRFLYFFSELYFMGRGYRYFIWFRRWRFKPLINKIKSIIKEEGIDHVIGVYPNPFYCHAACLAAKEMKVPFSSYFHNTYIENVAITDPEAPKIQQEIFNQSEYIFVMSKGMQQFYEEKYQLNKFVPLVHTFNKYPDPSTLTGLPSNGATKLVAIGNFNESNMDATRRFALSIKDHSSYNLNLYTHVPSVLLQKRGLDAELYQHQGFVGPDEVHGKLQDYDICVLTHGFTGGYGEVEYKTIFPTRTIPMLLSGKPIFAHSPPGSFLNDFIKEHRCAELVETADEQAVFDGLARLVENVDRQQELVAAAKETAKLFYGPNVVQQLKERLQ